ERYSGLQHGASTGGPAGTIAGVDRPGAGGPDAVPSGTLRRAEGGVPEGHGRCEWLHRAAGAGDQRHVEEEQRGGDDAWKVDRVAGGVAIVGLPAYLAPGRRAYS